MAKSNNKAKTGNKAEGMAPEIPAAPAPEMPGAETQAVPEQARSVKAAKAARYKAKADCFDERFYKKGEERVTDKDLDSRVWQKL